MRQSLTRILRVMSIIAIALVFTGCPTLVKLIEPIDTATVPTPDDYNQLAAAYWSSDMRALIGVFPGTDLPANGLTVEVQDPATLDPGLRALKPDFALEMGPSGTQFNIPVRVSTVIGKAVTKADGTMVMPNVDVYTTENGQPVLLDEVHIEFTEDNLVVVHALMPHFSPALYKVRNGLAVSIDSPKIKGEFLVGSSVPTQMTAINTTNADVWIVKPRERTIGKVGNIVYDTSSVQLPFKGSSEVLGKGSCECEEVGDGAILFEVDAKGSPKNGNKGKTAQWLSIRRVKCVEVYAHVGVSFDAGAHTTTYNVSVFLDDGTTVRELTVEDGLYFSWEMTGPCSGISLSAASTGYWVHEDCDGESEALTRTKIKVTLTTDTIKATFKYDEPARANEGHTVVILPE